MSYSKITNIDNGLNIMASGFVDDNPYSIEAKILLGDDKIVLPIIENQTENGFFVHMLKIEKELSGQFQNCLLYTSPSPRD